jgi:superfamily II DNA or RNA helicase
MNEINLYDYQSQAVEALRDNIRNGINKQILCAPTGSGKTVMATYLIKAAHEKGARAYFLCDRIALINQTSAVLDHYGIPHGVIQASHWRNRPDELIQVASQNTLERRGWPVGVDLMIVDEAHTIRKQTAEQIKKSNAVVIGLTATPFTPGLKELYQEIVSVTTTNRLIEEGKLCPFSIFAPVTIDMEGAKVVHGEWTDSEAAERAMRIVGDVVQNYYKFGAGRKFIAFGANIAHCEQMQRELMNSGVRCELYTSHTPDSERETILAEYRKPDSSIRGLISVAALAKGFDVPDVSCLIIARPLRSSFAEHIQIMGRGLRSDPSDLDKKCVVLDMAGNCVRFGGRMADFFENSVNELPEEEKKRKKKPPLYDYNEFYLEGDEVRHNGGEWVALAYAPRGCVPGLDPRWERTDKKQEQWKKCPKCTAVHKPRPECPECGFEYPRREIIHEDGELTNLEFVAANKAEQLRWYAGIRYHQLKHNLNDGWSAHKFRDKFGIWPSPSMKAVDPSPPDAEISGWLKHQYIKWIRGRGRAS